MNVTDVTFMRAEARPEGRRSLPGALFPMKKYCIGAAKEAASDAAPIPMNGSATGKSKEDFLPPHHSFSVKRGGQTVTTSVLDRSIF